MIKHSKIYRLLIIIYFIFLVLDLTRFGVSNSIQLSLKSIVYGMIFILFIWHIKLNNVQFRLGFFIKALLIVSFLSLFFTISIVETLKGIVSLLSAIILIIFLCSNSSMDKIFNLLNKSCLIVILISFVLYLLDVSQTYDILQGVKRFSGITYGTHPLSSICVFFILITISNFQIKFSSLFSFNSLFLIISFFLILKADSRQALIGLIISVLYLFWKKMNSIKRIFSVTILLILIFIFSQSFDSKSFFQNQSRSSSIDEITTLTGRTLIWSKAIKLIEAKPIVGYGFNAGQIVLEKNYSTYFGWTTRSAHNFVLQMGLDLGLIGVLLIILGVVYTFYKTTRFDYPLASAILLYCIIVSLVERGFSGSLTIYSFLLFLLNISITNKNLNK
jgi:exopolysaccharide production protein ExoQ